MKIKLIALAAACVFLFTSCDASVAVETILPWLAENRAAEGRDGAGGGSGGDASGVLVFSEKSEYGPDTAVVVNTTADVYAEPNRRSRRLTQLLFDEPVQIIDRDELWVMLSVDGRTEGWVRSRDIDSDWTCIDTRRYTERIVITDREKQIYSHPRSGIVIRDVGMGTELFVVSKSDTVYQVALPGNLTGWISANGTFELGAHETIKKTTAEIFAQSAVKFKGASYLLGGLSFHGIDSAGIIYIAAKVNGADLPRDFDGQFARGDLTPGGLEALEIGDVLFFSANGQSTEISNAGVYTGDGQFIHANQHTGRVQYEDVADLYYQQRVLGVKRYF